jgi:ABC-type transport system substrate-binding protein
VGDLGLQRRQADHPDFEASLGQIGVNVNLRTAAASVVFGRTGPLYDPTRLSSPTMNGVFYEWIQSAEPDDSFFWASNQIISKSVAAGGNFDGYVNPQIDQLTKQGLQTLDDAQRVQIYRKIQTILVRINPTSSSTGAASSARRRANCTVTTHSLTSMSWGGTPKIGI